jgi:quercetin dioxygenase-like cupin family protein
MPHARIVPFHTGEWVSFHSIPSEILAATEHTAGLFTLTRAYALNSAHTPAHKHPFAEAFYLMSGKQQFRAAGDTATLTAGDFIHIPGGVVHQPTTLSDERSEVLLLCLPAGFDGFQREVGLPVAGPDGPFPPQPSDFMQRAVAAGAKHGIELGFGEECFQGASGITVRKRGEGRRYAVAGDLYTFLVTGAETAGLYALWHAVIYPGGGPPTHTHTREEEAFYVLKGELTVYDGDEAHVVYAGAYIHLPRGNRHRFRNEGSQPVEMLILVAPAGFEQMLMQVGEPWPDATVPVPPVSVEEKQRLAAIAGDYGLVL